MSSDIRTGSSAYVMTANGQKQTLSPSQYPSSHVQFVRDSDQRS
jgi:hypothetical protein